MTIQSLLKSFVSYLTLISLALVLTACDGDSSDDDVTEAGTTDGGTADGGTTDGGTDDGGTTDGGAAGLHDAFAEFSTENITIYLDGTDVVIESNGLPNHTSPYWSSTERANRGVFPTENHPLFTPPTVTSYDRMVPGNIDDFVGTYTLTVPSQPVLAASSTATSLGPIGISVSGSNIYNDEEGAGRAIDEAIGGLDYAGAHTGPSTYHYHLETTAWSEDDENLIGVMADGFFLYGRRCFGEGGEHPDDLDASGGHVGMTQHSDEPEYHYHILNELYVESDSRSYVLFPGDYQGTPSAVSR